MIKHIFVSQSEKEMGRNRQHRRLEAIIDNRGTKEDLSHLFIPDVQFPDITLCKYLGNCPIPTRKKCMFNSGYENCNVYKFYKRWR